MPNIPTYAAANSELTAVSLVSIAALGQSLGIDFTALFFAFMGAACWRAIQPKIAPTLDEISRAFGWSLISMILGTLGAAFLESILTYKWPFFTQMEHSQLIGLPALFLGFFGQLLIMKFGDFIKAWSKPQ